MTMTHRADPLAARPGDDETLAEILADEDGARELVKMLECLSSQRRGNEAVVLRNAARAVRVLWSQVKASDAA